MTLDYIAGTDVSVGVFILVVLGGVIGLVLSGFTGWHISLACRNQTTIESLERTRYLTPLREVLDQERRKVMVAWNQGTLKPPANMAARLQALDAARMDGANGGGGNGAAASGQWTKDSDTNPGGFSHTVNPYQFGPDHLHELERHYIYVDDEETAQLPHAFDLGWRNNLRQLFGDSVLEWFLPFPISISLCGGSGRRKATGIGMGNGWEWQVSRRFEDAKQRLEEKRKGRIRDVVEGWRTRYWAQALAQGARPGSAGGSAAAGIGQGGAWPRPKNPYAVAAAKRAEEEARLDLLARARMAADQDTELDVLGDGDGVSMKALDMDGRSIRRYN
ncbi:palmitoyltransferase for Vac8p [Ascosphaera atra]|nr:palmitoyltransferase for Vac8p [Ascosphaera atra]